MSTPDRVSETTGAPAHATLEKDACPWRARDAAVRDAAARFASLLDDAPEQDQREQSSPDEPWTPVPLQDGSRPESEMPEMTPGEANEPPSTPRRAGDERRCAAERPGAARRPEERTPCSHPVEHPSAMPAATAVPTAGTGVDAPAGAPIEAGGALDTICQEIADRVLVSSSLDSSTPGEVRLLIRDGVLPQTEIRISRQAGELCVSILTGSAESYALLAQNKQQLDDRLAQRLGNARVEVVFAADRSGDDQQGGSRQRRSALQEEEGRL